MVEREINVKKYRSIAKKKCGKSQVKNVSDANVMLKKYQIFNTRV